MAARAHSVFDAADRRKLEVMDLATGFSVETTPGAAARIDDYRALLRPGTSVYVTFLPGSDLADTLAVARRLRAQGFEPVPHLAARSIAGARALDDGLARLTGEAGVRQVLCIGGAVDRPLVAFSDTMQMLATGLFDRHRIERIGLAGHPEGSPDISDAAIAAALAWKNAFAERTDAALHLVTQFCFEAAPIVAWERRLRMEGNRLPIHVGIPGVASLKALIGHAKACGVGPSMRFLTRQARSVARLLTLSTPDRLLLELAAVRARDPDCAIAGIHVYPLGGLKRTARYTYAVLDGAFSVDADGRGFEVDVDLG